MNLNMNRAERRRLREQHFRGAGRPSGRVLLTIDKSRFEIVWALVLMMRIGCSAYQAAYLTTILFHATKPLALQSLCDGHFLLSVEYGYPFGRAFRQRSEYLLRRMEDIFRNIRWGRTADPEQGWLIHSVWYLLKAIEAAQRSGETPWLNLLMTLGWAPALRDLSTRFAGLPAVPTSAPAEVCDRFHREVLPKIARNSAQRPKL